MSYQLQVNADPSKILYIDSRDAKTYLAQKEYTDTEGNTLTQDLTSYFQYQLTEKIEVPINQRALISLNSATIPYSFYNFRVGINDTLSMESQMSDGTTLNATLTIPDGNYTAYTLAELVEDFINTNLTTGSFNFRIDIDYDTDRQKFKYTLSKDDNAAANLLTTLQFTFSTKPQETPHIELGFPQFIDVNITLPASDAGQQSTISVFSTNVIDINGSIHGVYVRTNLVSNGTLDTQSGTFSNILSRIPINVGAGGIIFATPNNAIHRSVVDLRSIDILTIRLTDERNRILDLNGLHFQIAISIDFLYSKRKQTIPMGSLTKNNFGHSFHHEEVEDRRSKIKNNNKS